MKKIDITKPVRTKKHKFKVTELYRFSEPLSAGETIGGVVNFATGRLAMQWHDSGSRFHAGTSEYDIENVPLEKAE